MGHNIRGILDKAIILSFNRLFHGKMVQTYLSFFFKKKIDLFSLFVQPKRFYLLNYFLLPYQKFAVRNEKQYFKL